MRASEADRPARLVVLVDFDGTIARLDLSDEVMRRHADLAAWAPLEAAYLAGEIGSRTLLTRQAAALGGDTTAIEGMMHGEELDPAFRPFVDELRAGGAIVEVVSDGFGFFVRPSLERIGLGDVPVYTARTNFGRGGVSIDFPDGHPTCRVCGTCKRQRILTHQAAGDYTVFIGDGFSDLYAAGHADLVFAKDHLAAICADRGWPYREWSTFEDIRPVVLDLLDRGVPAPQPHPFICGPEVWPAGLTEPRWDRRPAPRP
ncbi:MAG TPA: HAD-IB family phosphatase [Candidatus Limnocylindrales bacterium]|nr:HAD-IB family phosphatase [Candidatus Limnocylindrales bacterium]